MQSEDLWIPIVMFISIAVVLCCWLYFRFRARDALQKTVQSAIEKGHELSPELLDRLGRPKNSKDADLRRGAIAVAIGVAFAAFAMILDEDDAVRPILASGSFPFLVGVAYLALWRFTGDKEG